MASKAKTPKIDWRYSESDRVANALLNAYFGALVEVDLEHAAKMARLVGPSLDPPASKPGGTASRAPRNAAIPDRATGAYGKLRKRDI